MNKKMLLALTIACTGIAGTFIACKKQEMAPPTANAAIKPYGKTISGSVGVSFDAGHPASQCHGQGACFNGTPNYFAHWVHIPCQGPGKECHWELSIDIGLVVALLEDAPHDINMPITDYHEPEFMMPERSIFIEETNKYMNIPKQVLQKNEDNTYQFKNVIVSGSPIYTND